MWRRCLPRHNTARSCWRLCRRTATGVYRIGQTNPFNLSQKNSLQFFAALQLRVVHAWACAVSFSRSVLSATRQRDHSYVPASSAFKQTLAFGQPCNHISTMFYFVRAITLTLIIAFSAGSIVGPSAAASMNIAMAKSISMANDDGAMKDCADQTSSKAAMKNCDLVCSATAAFAFVAAQDVAFSEAVFAVDHQRTEVRADGRTLVYDSPPPRSFILI